MTYLPGALSFLPTFVLLIATLRFHRRAVRKREAADAAYERAMATYRDTQNLWKQASDALAPRTSDELRDQIAEKVLTYFGHDRSGRGPVAVRQARGIADAVLPVVWPFAGSDQKPAPPKRGERP